MYFYVKILLVFQWMVFTLALRDVPLHGLNRVHLKLAIVHVRIDLLCLQFIYATLNYTFSKKI